MVATVAVMADAKVARAVDDVVSESVEGAAVDGVDDTADDLACERGGLT